jgi:hypothetical protein
MAQRSPVSQTRRRTRVAGRLASLTSLAYLTLILGIAACGGPTLIFPGGALDGEAAAAPPDWAFTHEVSTVQLETNPADPYSVNIWTVGIDDQLYVHAGANRATWVEHMETDPTVRVRVEEKIYTLAASRVVEQAEFDAFADAYEEKYGTRPREEDVGVAYLFRLKAR